MEGRTGEAGAVWFRETFERVRTEVKTVIVGQDEIVEGVLIGLAANGHILLEGMPGLGKTLLVHSLSQAIDLPFSRIQFTPDLMPADVTGTNIFQGGQFEFRRGPIFANIILADEINRATPKTQSAMLEAMQERAVTVGGKKYELDEPFLVMATQNPIEQEGTYPLPEAQLDRFMMKLLVPNPTKAELAEIVERTTGSHTQSPQKAASKEDILAMRALVREVPIAKPVLDFALSIVVGTHSDAPGACEAVRKYVRFGSSPRGAQSLVTTSKIRALLDSRFNVSKEDIRSSMVQTLRHRLLLNFEADADGIRTDQVIRAVGEAADAADRDPIKV